MLVKGYLYGCSVCNKSFSRKWNAERHSERMHDDLATINNKKIKPFLPFNQNQKMTVFLKIGLNIFNQVHPQ
jgi:hypothetical protein